MPAVDSVQLIVDVVAERANGVNAAFFNGIQEEWCYRIQQYINSAGSPPTVTKWTAIHARKNTFLNLYLAPAENSVQGQILRAMRQHELTLCPACGELGRPNTLDHYLPKDLYPHFCVTPVNLFPMCDACQLAKGTKIGDVQSPRFFIHPYFDTFVAEQVLRLEINAPFDAPAFSLGIVDELEPSHQSLIRSHMRELAIQRRYASFFRNQHRRLLRLVHRMRVVGQDVQQTLTTFKYGAAEPSLNAWDHVFYAAVSDNPDMIDYLTNAQLPQYL
jgi:5-methylcytosine-specific restriction endonuclease McrA